MQFKSLVQVMKHFQDEKVCIEFLEKQCWNGKPSCPHCKTSTKPYVIEGGKRYKCDNKTCHKKFSVTVGTIFENTKVKLNLWFAAIYLCTSRKKGISSYELSRSIGVTQKTAWFMLHRIREMFEDNSPELLTKPTQIDESYIGGKSKNKSKSKRIAHSQGRSTLTKTPVFGMLSEGKVRTKVVENTSGKVLKPLIFENIQEGSILISDEWLAYKGLTNYFEREIVKHRENQYVNKNGFHVNSLEGYWAIFKRTIVGTWHNLSKKHLQRYSNETAFRYNTRKETDIERFSKTLLNTKGRLTYQKLINKGKD